MCTITSVVITVIVTVVLLPFRDREGEDTPQNIVHDTVLSFGKMDGAYVLTRSVLKIDIYA